MTENTEKPNYSKLITDWKKELQDKKDLAYKIALMSASIKNIDIAKSGNKEAKDLLNRKLQAMQGYHMEISLEILGLEDAIKTAEHLLKKENAEINEDVKENIDVL